MFWAFIVIFVVIWIGNAALSIPQLRNFSSNYSEMRRAGKIVMGKQKNALSTGAIIMLGIDDDGKITEGRQLTGLTVLSRFKPMSNFNGQFVNEIDPSSVNASRSIKKALINAQENYRVVMAGGVPLEPPNPIEKVINYIDSKLHLAPKPAGTTPNPAASNVNQPQPVAHNKSVRVIRRRALTPSN